MEENEFTKKDLELIKDKELSKHLWEDVRELEEASKLNLLQAYYLIIDILKYYCDIEERYYSLIAIWIIGTYHHDEFPTYPYLFFNATKGSGKSRLLRLVTYLSKEGSMLNSLTDAVLFRTKGTLGIDEFEGMGRKGNETLKELLNSAYKKGIKVKRMKKVKKFDGENQEVEEFDVYRPILMANINGMEEVLGDRCIQIILSKSSNPKVTKKVEIYENDTKIQEIKKFQRKQCRLCRVVALSEMYICWNNFIETMIDTNDTINTNNTNDTNDTNLVTTNKLSTTDELFKKINDSEIDGRNLELMFPLIIIAYEIDENIFNELVETLKDIVSEKKKEDLVEGYDNMVLDFISQLLENKWYVSKELIKDFRDFIQSEEEWLTERWLGKSLKRQGLVRDKKRMGYGRMYQFNITKAEEQVKRFK